MLLFCNYIFFIELFHYRLAMAKPKIIAWLALATPRLFCFLPFWPLQNCLQISFKLGLTRYMTPTGRLYVIRAFLSCPRVILPKRIHFLMISIKILWKNDNNPPLIFRISLIVQRIFINEKAMKLNTDLWYAILCVTFVLSKY